MSDINLDQPKKLFSGFFPILKNVACTFLSITVPFIAWYISKDFKIMFIVSIICISISIIYTINKNSTDNKTLLKDVQTKLNNSNDEIKKLKEFLVLKDNEIATLTNDLKQITSNRDTVVERFYEYKDYKEAYNSVKNSMLMLSNMQKNKSIKDNIEFTFKNIEKDLHERNEDIEGYI